jgi:hypothetical protein
MARLVALYKIKRYFMRLAESPGNVETGMPHSSMIEDHKKNSDNKSVQPIAQTPGSG